jgi:hypothetical protein
VVGYEGLEDVLAENGVKERYDAVSARLPEFIGAAVRGIPLDAERLRPILDATEKERDELRPGSRSWPPSIQREKPGCGATPPRRSPPMARAATVPSARCRW